MPPANSTSRPNRKPPAFARLEIAVKPGSKHPGIDAGGETIVLRVRERAIDGAANDACIHALAAALGIPPSAIALLRGSRSRRKLFAIEGLTIAEALGRLVTNASR